MLTTMARRGWFDSTRLVKFVLREFTCSVSYITLKINSTSLNNKVNLTIFFLKFFKYFSAVGL